MASAHRCRRCCSNNRSLDMCSCFVDAAAMSRSASGSMETAYAIPRQKNHEIAFDLREVRYPWHRWFCRTIQTRRAGGLHYELAYLCKLPEAPPHTMLVEVPKWMFDAAECGRMRIENIPHVDCTILRALSSTITEQRASLKPAMIQPQLSRQVGNGGTDGSDSKNSAAITTGVVQRTTRPTALERSRRVDASRGGEPCGAASSKRSGSFPASTRAGRPR